MMSWKFASRKFLLRAAEALFALLCLANPAWADGDSFAPGYDVILDAVDTAADEECATRETGTSGKYFEWQACGSGGGNSFETIDVPAGTDPVADSSTDTLTVTETSPLTITGTAGTDTIDITWNTLTVAEGGTGATTLTGLLQGNGTSAVTVIANSSTVGQVLRVTGASTYAWGALDLADGDAITGTLPVSNGGTGITSLGAGVATWLGTPSASNLRSAVTGTTGTAGSLVFSGTPTLTTPLVGNGATGAGSLDFLEDSDNGTNVLRFIAPAAVTSDQTCTFENDSHFIPDSCVGDGTDGGGGDDLDYERAWPASSMEPLEAAESIPPPTKTTGTNIDEFSISYNADTDEGRKVTFVVPNDVASGTVTFTLPWWSLTATTGDVVWNVRYTSTGADSETWDATLTTLTATCTVDGTLRDMDKCQLTETVANLGWAAGDSITLMIYRDANNAADTMAGDAELKELHVRIPVS